MAIPEDDDKTRIIRRPGQPPPLPGNDDDTNITNRTDRPSIPENDEEEGGMTRLVGPPRRLKPSAQDAPEEDARGGESDPVVAWLVVMAGPGRGNSARLGYGQNSVGRDRDERVRLDFGDASISRKRHCFIIYEPRKRQYILRAGDSANLTYLNGELVSESAPIAVGDRIELGKTTLRFVPFCDADFDWQDQPATPA